MCTLTDVFMCSCGAPVVDVSHGIHGQVEHVGAQKWVFHLALWQMFGFGL